MQIASPFCRGLLHSEEICCLRVGIQDELLGVFREQAFFGEDLHQLAWARQGDAAFPRLVRVHHQVAFVGVDGDILVFAVDMDSRLTENLHVVPGFKEWHGRQVAVSACEVFLPGESGLSGGRPQ